MLGQLLAMWILAFQSGQGLSGPGIPIRGVVQFPDGRPAAGALVEASADCSDATGSNLHLQARTATDGTWSMPGFRPACRRVTIRASLLDELWLETGTDVFRPEPNGDSPVVTPAPDLGPIPIRLGLRGAKILFDVREQSSGKALRATISFTRVNVGGRNLGVLQNATGDNGDPHFVFVPGGDYFAEIDWVRCAGRDVFPVSAGFTFSAREGEVVRQTFVIDGRAMAAIRSAGNPNAEPCTP